MKSVHQTFRRAAMSTRAGSFAQTVVKTTATASLRSSLGALWGILVLVVWSGRLWAQQEAVHSLQGAHRLTLGLGHTQLAGSFEVEGIQSVPLASWSLDYDYGLSPHWGVGLQFEWLLESFVVEASTGAQALERAYPLSIIPVGLYRFDEHWTAVAGVGTEVSHGEYLTLTRLGIEFGAPVSKQWEFGAALVWDNKWNYYNSWGLAFTVSRIFSHSQD